MIGDFSQKKCSFVLNVFFFFSHSFLRNGVVPRGEKSCHLFHFLSVEFVLILFIVHFSFLALRCETSV